MSNNNLFQLMQQGFRVTVGATADLLEIFSDPQKRTETFTNLQTEFSQKTEEWAKKGEVTEQEARKNLENFLNQRGWRQPSATSQSSSETASTSNSTENNVQSELQELTEQIISLRNELEQLRKSEDSK
jgi:polyhydroxyalkanoate synthesis regulator phasin